MKRTDFIIIGGGAAGMAAAITAARRGRSVAVLEANDRIGKKIRVSGNGKCNITNRYIGPERFHSNNPAFVEDALRGETFESVETFLNALGLSLVEGKEGQIFPMSLQAASVIALLIHEAERLGVEIVTGCRVTALAKDGNTFTLTTSQGTMRSTHVLIASGSPAAPQLGGNDTGQKLATALGHRLVPPQPALVQLHSDLPCVTDCAGVKINGIARLHANGRYVSEKRGDLLFTPYGISGLAILDISREVSRRLAEYEICDLHLDLLPDLPKEKLARLLQERIHPDRNLPIRLWLHGILHQKLIPAILKQSHFQINHESELNRKAINTLTHALKNFRLPITGTQGWKGAEVAAGGIDTRDVDPQTMASKIVPGLCFAGEILDVDGDRGGFNFHWAWISGIKAGSH